MAYAVIEKSGSGIHKDRAKLRIDCFMNPDDPHYDKHYVYVPVFPEEGYPGKVDELGTPLDLGDYQKWEDALPHIWQNNPFHSHFIYPEKDASDADIKATIERVRDYFYTFHQQMWDTDKKFIDEWKKVPKRTGDVRCPFVKGDPKDSLANQQKIADITKRIKEFEIGVSRVPKTDLNIGDKGTITVGNTASDRAQTQPAEYTFVDVNNAADGTGSLDTIEIHPATTMSGTKAGTFSGSGTSYTNRDYETIGTVTAGAPDPDVFTGLSCSVELGDFIGIYFSSGTVDQTASGSIYYKAGDQFGAGTQSYTSFASILSLYGTGTEAGAGLSIPIAMHHYMQMANN